MRLMSKIKIHPLFWMIIAFGVLTGHFKEVFMVFSIVLIHEMGHVAAAHFFHWRIRKIQLLPFGGVAEVEEHGNRPLKEEVIVVLAGPLQHVWLVLFAYILYAGGFLNSGTFELFVVHNLMIFGFNLLPVWPLDGGKLLFHLISAVYPFKKAHTYSLVLSATFLLFAVISVWLFLPFHLNLWVILSFILFTVIIEWKQRRFVHIRFLLERYYGKNQSIANLSPIVVEESEKISDVLTKFKRGCKHQIIMFKDGHQMTYDENEILHAYFSQKLTTYTVGEVFG